VPRSSSLVSEDNDYALVSVVLFRRVVDDFRAAARSKGYQVREYVAPPAADAPGAEPGSGASASAEALKREVDGRRSALESWCRTAYGEAFSCWMHIAVVRVFVESILRYGLPPCFQAVVMRPAEKAEAKLRALLSSVFGSDAKFWKEDGAAAVPGVAAEGELHSYVSFTLTLDA
jgi:V-type H+-transporting ATPase subunit C